MRTSIEIRPPGLSSVRFIALLFCKELQWVSMQCALACIELLCRSTDEDMSRMGSHQIPAFHYDSGYLFIPNHFGDNACLAFVLPSCDHHLVTPQNFPLVFVKHGPDGFLVDPHSIASKNTTLGKACVHILPC